MKSSSKYTVPRDLWALHGTRHRKRSVGERYALDGVGYEERTYSWSDMLASAKRSLTSSIVRSGCCEPGVVVHNAAACVRGAAL